MKTLHHFTPLLLVSLLSLGTLAQTQPKKAPVRKPPSSQPTNKPTSIVNTPAPNRTNSEKLPANSQASSPTQQNRPTTVPTRQAHPRRAYAYSSGGLGYNKGDNLLNVGVGLSSYYYGNPIGASFEVGVDKDISVGGQLDYNSSTYGDYYYNSYRWRYTATYFGIRGSYHFNRILNLNTRKADLYAGVGLGYRTFRWNDTNYGYGYDYGSGVFLNGFIGGRYYFTNSLGAFAEFGRTGLSSARVGLSVKF